MALIVESVFTEIIAFLEPLSELTMPDSKNGLLEHLFKIDDLVTSLLTWFSKSSVMNDYVFYRDNNMQYFWIIIGKWLKIMSAITQLHSFRSALCDSDNNIHCTYILIIMSFLQHRFVNNLYHEDMLYVFYYTYPSCATDRQNETLAIKNCSLTATVKDESKRCCR